MSTEFFPRLSKNYIEILDDNEYYDVTIEVGQDPDVKIYRAHMIILCYRSPFLRQTLASHASNRKNNDLIHIKFSNITPHVFQNVLTYIYGGIISLDDQDISVILEILAVADQLHLQELVDYLQKYLIENKAEMMEQQFELTYQMSFQSDSLLELQQFCTDYMARSPEKMFKSLSFTSLPEKSLISLIRRDDLKMDEVNIWDHVLKWGLAQNPTINSDPTKWSEDDFNTMKDTLQNCLPYIRFFGLSSKDFLRQVRPYRKLLKDNLYEDLIEYHLDHEIEPPKNILFPRSNELGSKIININIASLISSWIDDFKITNERELYLPYEFKLLLRGSRDGFTPKKFHTLCDNIPYTVTLIKIKDTDEIIGGYNPLIWKESRDGEYGKTDESFIFSFKNKNNLEDAILSRVKDVNKAISCHIECGPTFSTDIFVGVEENDCSKEYNFNWCKKQRYEKQIRDTENFFSIEEYEVFQVVEREV
uniref:BTB/POZ domain-containing protein 9 n=1 Tax=Anthurium amnicola TaxID=1678845 RepID=A0A1D1Y373_9ARAE